MGFAPLTRLERSALEPVSALLTRAFADYPLFQFFLPGAESRRRRLRRIFRFLVECGLRYGRVYALRSGLEAVSLWYPGEGGELTLGQQIRAGGLGLPAAIGVGAVGRMLRFSRTAAQLRRRHAPGPHHYLQLLAVEPDLQGRGHGGRLLRANLERLSELRCGCYLETQDEDNVRFYRRHGFRAQAVAALPEKTLRTWCLFREAAGA